MIINLKEHSGEFCTARKNKGLSQVIQILKMALEKNEKITISTTGVKILTPSYIDELIPPLVIIFGSEKIKQLVSFSPPLTGFILEQIDRGIKNRSR